MNEELKMLYKQEIKNFKIDDLKSYDFDGPLLMNCWEEEYLNSEYKMLFVGRESNGWLGDLSFDVDNCIKKYNDFELCKNGNYTTFWQYVYEIKNALMPNTIGQRNFLWSNVSKYSNLDGSAINRENFNFFCDNFNVLQAEINIVKPDIIIFFSGSSWDEKLQYQINNQINFEQVNNNISTVELSRLVCDLFPYHTYRVEHPITLQLKKKWHYIELILEDIRSNKY